MRAGVDADEVREPPAVIDPVRREDRRQHRVVEVEEAVAVAQGLELLLPHCELQRPELASRDVPLRQHPDEGVELVDASVDRLQARCQRCPADTDDGLLARLVAMQWNDLAVGVPQQDEVEGLATVDSA